MALRDRIRTALDESGMKPADLARACGIRPASVSDWLSGKTKSLKAETALKAAKAMRVNPLWLTEGKGPKTAARGRDFISEETAEYDTKKTIDQLLDDLSPDLSKSPQDLRDAIEGLVIKYQDNPKEGERIAKAIKALLEHDD